MSFFGETQGSQKLTNPLRPSRAKKKEPFQSELVKGEYVDLVSKDRCHLKVILKPHL